MMKEQTNKEYSLLVYMKAKYKYTDSEEQLDTLCREKYKGRNVGGGTDLSTGKRDQQFVFNNIKYAQAFLKDKFTAAVILKDYDLVEVDSEYSKKITLNTVKKLGKLIARGKKKH
jgi:hypothetical protein